MEGTTLPRLLGETSAQPMPSKAHLIGRGADCKMSNIEQPGVKSICRSKKLWRQVFASIAVQAVICVIIFLAYAAGVSAQCLANWAGIGSNRPVSSTFVREWVASIVRIFAFVCVIGRLAKTQQSLGKRACLSWSHKVEMIARGIFLVALCEAAITTLYEHVCSYPESSLTLSWMSIACLPYSYGILVAKSFWMEVVFDFCHYWVHRACHSHPKLYKLAHKAHHRHHNPSVLCTLQQDIGETIFANFLPALIAYASLHIFFALSEVGVLSRFEMAYVMAMKIYQEIGGHMGTMTSISSFPICMWLPRALGIELRTSDHDLHHAMLKANYSKRFKLWDLVFGTYKKHPKTQS
mmetsp:Transcript_85215/g.160501  ORF Transcript_85215/g.160501 Transcript_85215/m.160501 type:complete len:351 (-) Transcript_85215:80-1132(-)